MVAKSYAHEGLGTLNPHGFGNQTTVRVAGALRLTIMAVEDLWRLGGQRKKVGKSEYHCCWNPHERSLVQRTVRTKDGHRIPCSIVLI